MKYRKKPVVIEAFRWTGGPDQTEDPTWAIDAMRKPREEVGAMRIEKRYSELRTRYVRIQTLEGPIWASPGDFIIQGVQGEPYPCKPDIFEATYEPVEAEKRGAER